MFGIGGITNTGVRGAAVSQRAELVGAWLTDCPVLSCMEGAPKGRWPAKTRRYIIEIIEHGTPCRRVAPGL